MMRTRSAREAAVVACRLLPNLEEAAASSATTSLSSPGTSSRSVGSIRETGSSSAGLADFEPSAGERTSTLRAGHHTTAGHQHAADRDAPRTLSRQAHAREGGSLYARCPFHPRRHGSAAVLANKRNADCLARLRARRGARLLSAPCAGREGSGALDHT